MPNSARNRKSADSRINKVETTAEDLTARAGLAIISRYLRSLNVLPHLARRFSFLRKSSKGLPVEALFKQIICFFVDGTSRHMAHFDRLREDGGYAGVIETVPEKLASSHQMKRFFQAFRTAYFGRFRTVLHQLFLRRLKLADPDVVVLGLDSMILDNDDAAKREGVKPTYKGVKGYHPLQLTWGPYVVDAIFPSGEKHSNHEREASEMIVRTARRIREVLGAETPIIVRMDAGFLDQEIFRDLESTGIFYLTGSKVWDDLQGPLENLEEQYWSTYANGEQEWHFAGFWDCRGTWDRYRRAIYSFTTAEDGQRLLEFASTENFVYTNLDANVSFASEEQRKALEPYLEEERIVELYHGRGKDERVHRALKSFGPEALPLQGFAANAAFYYIMLVAFFLYEAYSRDVTDEVISAESYATTFRRQLIDVAGKIVRTAGYVKLKVTETVWKALDFERLWEKAASPPAFVWL